MRGYVWHDLSDGWCGAVPASDVEVRGSRSAAAVWIQLDEGVRAAGDGSGAEPRDDFDRARVLGERPPPPKARPPRDVGRPRVDPVLLRPVPEEATCGREGCGHTAATCPEKRFERLVHSTRNRAGDVDAVRTVHRCGCAPCVSTELAEFVS